MNHFSLPISSAHASDRVGISVDFVTVIPKCDAHPGNNPLGKEQKLSFESHTDLSG